MDEILRVLVVDDEEGMCLYLKNILSGEGFQVNTFTSSAKALKSIREKEYDVAIVDMRMPEPDGINFLRESLSISKELSVIMMTAYGSIENAVEAIKMGAYDYITKPFKTDEIMLLIRKTVERKKLIEENRKLKKELESIYRDGNIIGKNSRIKDIVRIIHKIAPSNQSVLITGESGTGKEVAAAHIHESSSRREGPFVTVQCNLLPVDLFESELFGHKKGSFTGAREDKKGLFEEADGGTLFLDEIGDITLDIQGKLLRFLQHREIRRVGDTKSKILDVRIILATNKSLENLVMEKKFREDLFYRIKVMSIELPPLRDRKEDIPLLIQHFLDLINQSRKEKVAIDRDSIKHLMEYHWPGNIRELKNCIETAAVICDHNVISTGDIMSFIKPAALSCTAGQTSFKEMKAAIVSDFERNYLVNLLIANRGNIAAAAREADMDRKNFFDLMRKYNINADSYK